MRTFEELTDMTLMVAHGGRLLPVGTIDAVRGLAPDSHLDSPHIDVHLPSIEETTTIHAADFDYMQKQGRFAIAANVSSSFVGLTEKPAFHPSWPSYP